MVSLLEINAFLYTHWTLSTQEAGVRRIAVGIGSAIDLGELQQIASNNKDVLQVQNYGQLDSKLEEIMTMACEEQYPGKLGQNWGMTLDWKRVITVRFAIEMAEYWRKTRHTYATTYMYNMVK